MAENQIIQVVSFAQIEISFALVNGVERDEKGAVVSSVTGIHSEKLTAKLTQVQFPRIGSFMANPVLGSQHATEEVLPLKKKGEGGAC